MKQGPSKDIAKFLFCWRSAAKPAVSPYQQLMTNPLALAIHACRAVRIHSPPVVSSLVCGSESRQFCH